MALHEAAADREAQPGPSFPTLGPPDPVKPLEDAWQLSRRDSLSEIDHSHLYSISIVRNLDADRGSVRRVFHRVIQQIHQDMLNVDPIHQYRRKGGGYVQFELPTFERSPHATDSSARWLWPSTSPRA